MSYAAEPYPVFVDDLLGNLTGAVTRVRFRFIEEEQPFQLGRDEHPMLASLRAHGLVDGAFYEFVPGIDFVYDADTDVLAWLESEDGLPAAGASWPDPGSLFWVAYDREPGHHVPPRLNDRNPGSITRTLAESFAIEFAVLSLQLEKVYEAGHLATAERSDLERVVELVGLRRRGQLHAQGDVTFRRSTPVAGDVTIAAGTLVSSSEPPKVTVETTETVTLRRGTISVVAPVRAQAEGPAGVAAARTLTVIQRPVFGIEEAINPQALRFGGGAESDAELRRRASRALSTSGRSTVDALRGALASLDEIREQDVLIEEDHLAFPGVVKIKVASIDRLTPEVAVAAAQLLEEYRPAGIRVIHNLPVVSLARPSVGTEPGGGGNGPTPEGLVVDDVQFPIVMRATVTPSSTELTARQRQDLVGAVDSAVRAQLDNIAIGEALIYNETVTTIMGLEGVFDVVVDVSPAAVGSPTGRVNLAPATGSRIELAADGLEIVLRGALVALDVTAKVERLGTARNGDAPSALAAAADDIATRLTENLQVGADRITPPVLLGQLLATETYRVLEIGYDAEFVEDGLRILRSDVTIDLAADQQAWIRRVRAVEGTATS